MATADLANATIGQIAVRVGDLDRAVRCYRDQLGLPLLFQFPGLAFFKAGEVRLMLSRAEHAEDDHPGSFIYFRVPDIEAAHRTLADRGIVFRSDPHIVHRDPTYELWMADFRDSEGNPLVLMSEKPTG